MGAVGAVKAVGEVGKVAIVAEGVRGYRRGGNKGSGRAFTCENGGQEAGRAVAGASRQQRELSGGQWGGRKRCVGQRVRG